MLILGLSSGHDANLCVLRDGELLLHVEKERLTRRRYDSGSMEDVVVPLCREAGVELDDIDLVATSIPVWTHVPATGTFEGPAYRDEMGWTEGRVRLAGRVLPAVLVAHHLGHAAYAFYTSPFPDADVLTLDAGGNFTCGMFCRARAERIELVAHLDEQSLGIAWCALALRLFGNIFAAGKVMGLAPYGAPRLAEAIWQAYGARGRAGRRVISLPFPDEDRGPSFPGLPDGGDGGALGEAEQDAAASLQAVTNEMVLDTLRGFAAGPGARRLCFGGGVALNCVLNEAIRTSGLYDEVFVPPAPGDGGLSIGFALHAWHGILGRPRRPRPFFSPFSGRIYPPSELEAAVESARRLGFVVRRFDSREGRDEQIAALLAEGKTVGVHQGRSESGPRALGHRSILADARDPGMKARINSAVKFREPFRPFAPAVMAEHAGPWLGVDVNSPYMSFAPVVAGEVRDVIPAATHVDGSARLQTVSRERVPELWGILHQFARRTGVPALLNTSLNARGEPICETLGDSLRVLAGTGLDALAVEDFVVRKAVRRP